MVKKLTLAILCLIWLSLFGCSYPSTQTSISDSEYSGNANVADASSEPTLQKSSTSEVSSEEPLPAYSHPNNIGIKQDAKTGWPYSYICEGEWEIPVPGFWNVGSGWGGMPCAFYFYDDTDHSRRLNSFLLANPRLTTEEMKVFQNNWLATAQYMEREARRIYGEDVNFISFDDIRAPDGNRIYVMYLELEDENSRMEITACYRFMKDFSVEYIGVNMGDKPDMFKITKEAAKQFVELTDDSFSGVSSLSLLPQKGFSWPPESWKLPISNVFAVLKEYTIHTLPPPISDERIADDYEIEWSSQLMEFIARHTTGIEEGPIMSSDLDYITYLRIISERRSEDPLEYIFSSGTVESFNYIHFSMTELIEAQDLGDISHFKSLTYLLFDLPDVRDIGFLKGLDKVTDAHIYVDKEISDISPLVELKSLQRLNMWWGYNKVTDISFFAELQDLQSVSLSASNIKDASVFCEIPSLQHLELYASDDLDRQPLIDCKHITELEINREKIR